MNFLIDVRQLKKPERHETLANHPVFCISFNLKYEVDYLPHHIHMNLKSSKIPPLHLRNINLLRDAVSAFLSRTLVPQSQFDSIDKIIFSKVKSIASDPRNGCFNFIPVTISIRVIWVQNFDLQVELAWERLLPGGRRISNDLPATERSIGELETVVYGGGLAEKEEKCRICSKEYKGGEEIKRMPCLHVYHGDCIFKWLNNSNLCPSCRFPMPVCRVVEGTFPFFRRKHCGLAAGGKIRKGARMSTDHVCWF